MNNKVKTLLIVVALIAVIAGALLLYNSLKSDGGNGFTPAVSTPSTASTASTVSTDETSAEQSQPESLPEDSSAAAESSEEVSDDGYTRVTDFTMLDKDGNEISFSDISDGKPVVVNCWASWCGYCVNEMPDYNEAYLERGKDVVFMMINITDGSKETLESAKAFLAAHDYTFPVYFDVNGSAAKLFGASSLPTTVLISADWRMVAGAKGSLNKEAIIDGIEKYLLAD